MCLLIDGVNDCCLMSHKGLSNYIHDESKESVSVSVMTWCIRRKKDKKNCKIQKRGKVEGEVWVIA